jgi:hypothetical protein
VSNSGTVPVIIGNVFTVGDNFSIAANAAPLPCPGTALPPGGHCIVNVSVTQLTNPTQSGALIIVSSAGIRETILQSSGAGPFVLGLLMAGLGNGTVTVAPQGYLQWSCSIPPDQPCPLYAYPPGTSVTLTAATLGTATTFLGWGDLTGVCGGLNAGLVCGPFIMDDNKLIVATFPLDHEVLEVAPNNINFQEDVAGVVVPANIAVRVTEQSGAPAVFRVKPPAVPWISANPVVGLTPATVTFTVNPLKAPVAPGNYQAIINIDPPFVAPAFVSASLTVTSQQYTLTVAYAGTGTGTVSLTPPGGTYAPGTVVTLTATPNTGSTFAGWSGACSGTGTCTVTMNSNLSVTATFNGGTFNLLTFAAGTGSGTILSNNPGTSCGIDCASYPAGTVVQLTASANTGSTFTGWSGACSGTGACSVAMNSNQTLTATFNLASAQQFTLTTTMSGTGSGTVSSSPSGTSCGSGCLSFAAGTVATLTATPNSSSTFAGWSGTCSGTGVCTLTMNANQTVTATFNLQTATVTLSGVTLSTGSLVGGNPATGTVTLSGPAGSGGVSVALQSSTPSVAVPASVTVPAGQTSANFAVSTSAVAAQTNATISASLNGTVKTATLTLTPVPAGGGALTGTWTGTWTDTETNPSCVFTTTLTWNLTQTGSSVTGTYTVLVTAGAPASNCSSSVGGSNSGNFVQGTVSGSSVTLTSDANLNGIVFSGTVAGTTISGTGSNSFEGGPFSVSYR